MIISAGKGLTGEGTEPERGGETDASADDLPNYPLCSLDHEILHPG